MTPTPGYLLQSDSGTVSILVPCPVCRESRRRTSKRLIHWHGAAGAKVGDVTHRVAHCDGPAAYGHIRVEGWVASKAEVPR